MLRSYKGVGPRLGQRVYVDASAQVIGDVELGDHASVWMNAVVRGDVHSIRIGPYTNIQDNCVVHVFKALHPTVVADHVTVGMSVFSDSPPGPVTWTASPDGGGSPTGALSAC